MTKSKLPSALSCDKECRAEVVLRTKIHSAKKAGDFSGHRKTILTFTDLFLTLPDKLLPSSLVLLIRFYHSNSTLIPTYFHVCLLLLLTARLIGLLFMSLSECPRHSRYSIHV